MIIAKKRKLYSDPKRNFSYQQLCRVAQATSPALLESVAICIPGAQLFDHEKYTELLGENEVLKSMFAV